MKPIIGIVGKYYINKDNNRIIQSNLEIIESIIKPGGNPIIISPNKNKLDLKKIIDICDGIILQGGYNFYKTEEIVYKYALIKDKSILGICAGMQLMCNIDLTNSIKDKTIKNNTFINHNKNTKYAHNIKIIENTKLYEIFKNNKIKVNSRHNYHIKKVKNLHVCAISNDNIIEAVEYSNKNFVIGVEWHPESMIKYDKYSNKLFKEFIKSCKK